MADDYKQAHFVLHDRGKLVWRVANPLVMCDRHSIFRAAVFQPLLIGSIRLEELVMSFYGDTCARKDCGKLLPEIAISEVNQAQAARRSYSTAFSISSTDKS